ncbi:MAG TPA: glutathione transferase [Candidatus Binatia bacterium]|jgi:glutathione S-transferase
MTAADLILYVDAFYISPYAFSAFVALREKGLRFETRFVPLQEKAQQRPDYRDGSVTARVPALVHGDFWLAESSAIDEYLEDVFPPPEHAALYPRDPRQRARARQVQAWLRSDLGALRDERPTTTMFYGCADRPLSAAGKAAAEKLVRVTEQLLTADAEHLFGAWSIADADLAFMLQRLVRNDEPMPARARTYAEHQWRRPAVREWDEQRRLPLVPYEG